MRYDGLRDGRVCVPPTVPVLALGERLQRSLRGLLRQVLLLGALRLHLLRVLALLLLAFALVHRGHLLLLEDELVLHLLATSAYTSVPVSAEPNAARPLLMHATVATYTLHVGVCLQHFSKVIVGALVRLPKCIQLGTRDLHTAQRDVVAASTRW